MKNFTLVCLLAMLCQPLFAQQTTTEPFYVSDKLPDYTISNIINYAATTATITQLQAGHTKLVLFDFWFTACAACIRQFPKLDSLQKKFKDRLQIVLVTHEPDTIVIPFIARWEQKNHKKFELPIITSDTLLHQSFRHLYDPHYAWIAPDNVLLGQTSSSLVSESTIAAYLSTMDAEVLHRGSRKKNRSSKN